MAKMNGKGKNQGKSSNWSKRKDIIKTKDDIFYDAKPTDIIIPVMGKRGVGKSTFINTLLGSESMRVAHDFVPRTAEIQWAVVDEGLAKHIYPKLGDRRLVLVEMPGFDDAPYDDSEILRRIGAWLGSCYAFGLEMAGIIYLQNIAERRVEGASRRDFEIFKKLCGTGAFCRVIIATTSWQEIQPEIGNAREDELRSKIWKDMIQKRSKIMRFDRTQDTAIDIMRRILERTDCKPTNDPLVLQIQAELVDIKKYLPQTDAGKQLLFSIEEILEAHKDRRVDNEQEKEELQQKVRSLEAQINSLRLPFLTRFKASLVLQFQRRLDVLGTSLTGVSGRS